MKKTLVTTVLVLAAVAFSQAAPQPQAQATAPQPQTPPGGQPAAPAAQPAAPPQQKKEIKDPAEYNAYVGAVQQQDQAAKASGLEAFLQQYPNSVMKEDALEQLMGAYQQSGNTAKVASAADRLLQVDANNVRALVLMAYLHRADAENNQNPAQNAAQARQFGERGLQVLKTMAAKPEGMSDADFAKLKAETTVIFSGAAGFGALQAKDYKAAEPYLQAAVDASPNNLRDVYPLAVAYLEDSPVNPLGLWYVARAVNLSNNNAQIVKYGQYKYRKYHGSDQGWNELVAAAKASPPPPPGFTVAPAPTPAEQAANLANSKDPKQMNFDEWQLVLTQGEQATADKVWNAIKGMKVPFAAKVVSATKDVLKLAATADDIQKNVADVEVTMAAPLTAALVPKVGSDTQVQATLDSYQKDPFLIKMTDGLLIVKAPPKKAPPKRPVRRRRAR